MLAVIFTASLLPIEQLPKVGSDKVQHFVSYTVLAWWFALSFQTVQLKPRLALALKIIAFSGIVEILQGLSGYRYAEWLDLLANSAGVFIGFSLAAFLTPNALLKIDYWLRSR